MERRRDNNYICIRVTEEERQLYDEKLRKTSFIGKTFLLKCIYGEKIRELAPTEASNVHCQLSKIDTNLMELASVRNNLSPKMIQLYDVRYKQFHKTITDITTIIYLAQLSIKESCFQNQKGIRPV